MTTQSRQGSIRQPLSQRAAVIYCGAKSKLDLRLNGHRRVTVKTLHGSFELLQ
jgi:hypothetical protein